MRRGPRTAAVAGLTATVLVLASCGSEDGPVQVTGISWQVTSVGDTRLDAVAQATTWLSLGGSSFTGAAGCVRMTGDTDWHGSGDSATVTLSDLQTTTEGDCGPGDRYNADLVTDVLTIPDLRWAVTDDNALREFRVWVDGDPGRNVSFSG